MTKTPAIHFRSKATHPRPGGAFQACDGRATDSFKTTTDRAEVTCKRCLAKYPATVYCPTCGRAVAHDGLEFCADDLTRCQGEGGCLARFLAREPSAGQQ